MSTAYCRECLGSISTEALNCPYCGISHPLAEPTAPTRAATVRPARAGNEVRSSRGMIGAALVVGAAAFGMLLQAQRPTPRRAPPASSDSLRVAARAAVEPDSGPWYAGGTLQEARISEWRVATPRNKLASAAELAGKLNDTFVLSDGRPLAKALVTCIDLAAVNRDLDAKRISDVAADCLRSVR